MKSLFCCLMSLPLSVLAGDGLPEQPYIYVQGKAEVEKPADLVTLRFELVTRNPDQAKANEEAQAKARQILTSLNDRKIAQNDVIAGDLKSEPQYETDETAPSGRGKLTGYSVTRPFVIKVRDVTIFPKLVDDLLAISGVQFSGIEPGIGAEKQIQAEVWAKAVGNARERADKTVRPMGMKIDSVFAVSPVTFPEIQREIFGAGPVYREAAAERATIPDPSQYRLAPVTVSQSVHVIYLISAVK